MPRILCAARVSEEMRLAHAAHRAPAGRAGRVGAARRGIRGAALSVLLDTHMWVWWLTPESPLTRPERDALDAKAGRRELFLPAISLWEVQVAARQTAVRAAATLCGVARARGR